MTDHQRNDLAPRSHRSLALALGAFTLLAGCGARSITSPPPTEDTDAGAPLVPEDAGAPPARADAGPDVLDDRDAGPGLTLDAGAGDVTWTAGHADDFGTVAVVYPDIVFGHRIHLDERATLVALAVIAGAGGPRVQLALYSDAGGPADLVVQTGEIALQLGPNEIPVDPRVLAAGDYWLVVQTGQDTPLTRTPNGDNDYELAFLARAYPEDGALAFPPQLTEAELIEDYAYNLYVRLAD